MCYRSRRPEEAPRDWNREQIDAITVSSAQGLANLFEMLAPEFLRATPLFVPHPRVADEARARAVQQGVVAGPSDEQLVGGLVAYFRPMTETPTRSATPILLLVAMPSPPTRHALLARARRGRIGARRRACPPPARYRERRARGALDRRASLRTAGREAQVKVLQLEARLANRKAAACAGSALPELSRNRDEWQLPRRSSRSSPSRRSSSSSPQRARRAARAATREARLTKADRPQFLPLRRALGRDIESLKALPVLDIAAMSSRIDSLVAGIDSLPLAFDSAASAQHSKELPRKVSGRAWGPRCGASSSSWCRAPGRLVRAAAAAAAAAYFLRENLRLRLLKARLAPRARRGGNREDFAPRSRGSSATSTCATSTRPRPWRSSSSSPPVPHFEMPTISGASTRCRLQDAAKPAHRG